MSGLEGVVVAETKLSDVDGERGRLIIMGYDVEALALETSFEGLTELLLGPVSPTWRAALGAARVAAYERIDALGDALERQDGMDALRAAVAHLPTASVPAVIGAVGTYAAAWSRASRGLPLVAPNPELSHAHDVLRMVDEHATSARVAALEAYLVTVSDHGMNASTFAARVVASTGSDLTSSIVAAIGALKGPLHGGAPGPVLDMLDAIGDPSRAASWLESELGAGRRIMGMGHRVYRVRDPRAAVLERAIERLERLLDADSGATDRLALARAVERAAEGVLRDRYPNRPLHANVEFYTAVLLDAVGLPRTMFTPMFAVGRVVGWAAHVEEQQRTGRLIRPTSRYVGPAPQ